MLDFSFDSYLPIASFALAAGGLAVRFLVPSGPAKQTLIAAVLIFLVLGSGLMWQRDYARTRRVRAVAAEIIRVVGNEKRTVDDIMGRLRKPEYSLVVAAIDLLHEDALLGSDTVTIIDKADNRFPIRLYYVRSP
jgi:hypothetical protein